MKKSAIALAVASALVASAAAHAETTFYGRLALDVNYNDPDTPGSDGVWDVGNAGSRWGVKGSEDVGNGLSVIYHLETLIRADTHNGNQFQGRLAWVGLKGGFGAVKLGAQWSPYYNVGGRADIFNNIGWYAFYNGPFRVNNSIVYETPSSISAFKGEVMLVMDGDNAADDTLDEYNLGANFSFGPVGGGVAYRDVEGTGDQFIVAASVDVAGASIAGVYEHMDPDAGAEEDVYYVTAQYKIGNNTLRAGWGREDTDGAGGGDRDQWAVGVQHQMTKRTRFWVEYGQIENGNADASKVSLGFRHDF